MPKFSETSLSKLRAADVQLQLCAQDTVEHFDISVLWTHRGQADQDDSFARGTSKVRWPHGAHNSIPSRAIDICPYHRTYGKLIGNDAQVESIMRTAGLGKSAVVAMIREHYCLMAGIFLAHAKKRGIAVRWGGDWNQDNDLFNNSFDDLGHFELSRS